MKKKGINQHSITYSKQTISFFLSSGFRVRVLHMRYYFPIEPLFLPGCFRKAAASGDEEKGKGEEDSDDDDDEEDVIMRVGNDVLSRRAVEFRINGRSVRVVGYMVVV